MKKKFDLWLHSRSDLKKLIMELKIAFLIVVLSSSTVFANSTYEEIGDLSEFYFNTETESLQQSVKGKVTDAQTGNPMPGVNVLLKGTTVGEITDTNGEFTLSPIDKNAVLIV